MSDTNEDPMLAHLRGRRTELITRRDGILERLAEIDELLSVLADGRSRVRRKMKGEVSTPPSNGASEPTTVPAEAG